ncbi:MAG: tol-pal system protein YbgF [Deltaproteobacteria bacterium]|nr:MAG: tol-pal system protein YbgF [Deltaproteobacteria bacterium]
MKRLLLIALCSVACVTTAQEGEQMRADIAALRTDLKKEMDATSADRQKDQQRAKALQDALDQLSRAARKSGADLAVDLEKAQNDLSSVRGQIEVLQHRLDALEKTSQENQKALDAATQFMAQRQKEAEHPTDRGPLYNLARQRLDQGQAAKARDLFQDFMNRYPKDELAANAQYWLGETYFTEKKWNDAIVEFQKVLKEYKGSDKVPDALLKIGMSFQAQGDCQNALLFFDEVVQAHKSSPAAKAAHDRSAECKRKNNQSRKR